VTLLKYGEIRMDEETLEILEKGLEDIDTIDEMQAYIVFASEFLDEPELELADHDSSRLMDRFHSWIGSIRDKMSELAEEEAADSYSISVSGGMTGVSVSLSVTYDLE
jgi:hypothetical protein